MKCRYELMVHRRVVHNCGSSEKCGVCGAAFGSQTELKQHRIACHSNRPFACPECPHRFALFDMAKDVYMCECGAATDAGKVADMEAKLEEEVGGEWFFNEVISEQ